VHGSDGPETASVEVAYFSTLAVTADNPTPAESAEGGIVVSSRDPIGSQAICPDV
jgi:hypothetical protein